MRLKSRPVDELKVQVEANRRRTQSAGIHERKGTEEGGGESAACCGGSKDKGLSPECDDVAVVRRLTLTTIQRHPLTLQSIHH